MTVLHARTLRIALCKSSLFGPISGADETLVTYVEALRDAGHDAQVVLLYPPPERDSYLQRLRQSAIPVHAIADRSLLFRLVRGARTMAARLVLLFALFSRFPGHVRRIWQLLLGLLARLYYPECVRHFRSNRFDVIHILTPDSVSCVLIRAGRAAGLPVLYQELGTPFHMPELGNSYQRLAQVTPLCTRIAALSPTLARQWQGRLPHPKQIGILPLLVPSPVDLPIPRRHFPFDVTFGFAARLERGKGPDLLLESFAELTRHMPGLYLRIAGVGPLSYALRKRNRALGLTGQCEFSGKFGTPEGRTAFLNTIDVFVLPSLAEGTPNCIIEAMAAGLPIIATDVGGIPDMLTEECGILVPAGDAPALREAMAQLARDGALRKRMGSAARARYEELYAPAATLPQLLAMYGEVAGNPRATSPLRAAPPELDWQTG